MAHARTALVMLLAGMVLPLHAAEPKGEEPSTADIAAAARDAVVVVTYSGRSGDREGLGTGFIVDADGLIATNLHVIGEARPIQVELVDGRHFDVTEVVASDRHRDLALIRIDAKELPVLPLAEEDSLRAGEEVVVFGNPLGLTHSVVTGTVSAMREEDEKPLIQIGMPVQPGNSGGPVLDLEGKVQGVVSQRSLRTPNVAYAVATKYLKTLMDDPNPIPMKRWLTIGAIDPDKWTSLFGARWRQRAGTIRVDGLGRGFGGRSLLLAAEKAPEPPFEIAVDVRLEDEAGAAGLIFSADGRDRHYGFYPSGGRLRLSRFEGADVFSWRVLEEVASPAYQSGEWNHLRVRVEPDRILAYVNDSLVVNHEHPWNAKEFGSKVGLAKFRDTEASYKGFAAGRTVSGEAVPKELAEEVDRLLADLSAEVESSDRVERLAKSGPIAVTALRRKARRLQREARLLERLAEKVHEERIRGELAKETAKPEEEIDLIRAALLIAQLDNDELDVSSYEREFAQLADELEEEIAEDANEQQKIAALNRFLFEEMGFHGSRTDYGNPANSYLNEVIDDREGLPISLSILYMELAQRIGLPVVGVGLPGHFVVRLETMGDVDRGLIDVFDRGKALTRAEAERKVADITGSLLREEHLAPVSSKAIIIRMLRNLGGSAVARANPERMIRYLDAILAIAPDVPDVRMTRAYLHYRAMRPEAALVDVDWILSERPSGFDFTRLREFRQMLREQVAASTNAVE
ncbi:putative periplasmic serine endoprotease DegP-like precursor [Planctomycetes bacterium Pan216]|uniref:Putative periplasmic serine endoprotease DegP-like n=1 Tax=Kolteria novifilia TaxID=2527975 RepID=A0A518AX04_9BACT|nr:putative periplasmic serine endoprotease DegP-like precursor [Planctomycetes bacterium Pan216]